MHPHEPRSAGSGAVGRTSITSVPPAAGSRERTDSPPDPPAAVELETSVEVRRGIGDLAAEIDRLADGPFVRPGWFEGWLRGGGAPVGRGGGRGGGGRGGGGGGGAAPPPPPPPRAGPQRGGGVGGG